MEVSLHITASNEEDLQKLTRIVEMANSMSPINPDQPDTVVTEPAPQTVAPQTVAPQTVAPQTVAPQTVAPQTVAAGEPDARGVPWSIDHHTKGKTKMANGDWKPAKGSADKDLQAARKAARDAYEAPFLTAAPTQETVPAGTSVAPTPGVAPLTPPLTAEAEPFDILTARFSEIVKDDLVPLDMSRPWGDPWVTFHTMQPIDAISSLLASYGVINDEGVGDFGELQNHINKIPLILSMVDQAWPRQ